MKNKTIQVALLAALTTSVHAQSFILDFNTDDTGSAIVAGNGSLGSGYDFTNLQPYAEIYGNNQGVTFTSLSGNLLTVYDTEFGGADLTVFGEDDDLEPGPGDVSEGLAPGYEGGNNPALQTFGNAFILQTAVDGTAANNIDLPNDSGPGGSYRIDSDLALGAITLDILDVDNANPLIFFTFTDTDSGEQAQVFLSEFQDGSGSVFETDDVQFGDRHSNNIEVTLAELQMVNSDLTQFDRITFSANSSGAVAEIEVIVIPEPSSALLAGLGLLTLTFRRKK